MQGQRWARRWVAGGAVGWWLALLVTPGLALRIWWGGVIPLLPALLMVAPRVWRNVCPVAAVEVMAGSRSGRRLGVEGSVAWGGAGLALFALLVAGRPHLFNRSATALAAAVAVATLLAAVRGRTHAVRAGFCNSFCPLGGVERLYGQLPVVNVAPAHCPSCSACTRLGCPDVAGSKALRQLLGPSPRPWSWLLRPHGAFAAALPGFTVGYAWATGTGSWAGALSVLAAGSGASWLATVGVSLAVADASRRLPLLLAGASGLAFYQLVAPPAVAVWGLPGLVSSVRIGGTVLVLTWVVSGLRGAPGWARRRGRRRVHLSASAPGCRPASG